MKTVFYTYVLRDPRDFEPIYVGKGHDGRMHAHWKTMLAGNPRQHGKLYNKLTSIFCDGYPAPIYEKWLESTDEKLCFWMERFLIKAIGRENLCNGTDGGEGLSGQIISQDHRRKISERHTGERNFWFGKTISEEHRRKVGQSNKNRTISEESKVKWRSKMKGSNSPLFGKKHSEERCQKNRDGHLGLTRSEKSRRKQGDSVRGEKHWAFGKSFSKEHCRKMSEAQLGKPRPDLAGKNHWMFGKGYLQAGDKNPAYGKGYKQIGSKNPMYGRTGEKHPNFGKEGLTGEKNPATKLTDKDVRTIHQSFREGSSKARISRIFKITDVQAGNIVRGKSWRHIYREFHPDSLAFTAC